MYKISGYNYYIEHKNRVIYFNGISSKLIILKPEEHQNIQALFKNLESFEVMYPSVFQQFVSWNYINNYDELDFIKKKYKNKLEDKTTLFLTINPTLDCVFNCWYCFVNENVDVVKKTKMQPAVVDNVINLIGKCKEEYSNIHLNWFGGEPMMYFKDIFQKICDHTIINYDKSIVTNTITTNGYLIDQNTIEYLKKIKLDHIQITLDGARKRHNSIRYVKLGEGSYDKIINNITLLSTSLINTSLIIRINYDEETLYDIDSIIHDLSHINKSNVLIDLQRVWQVERSRELDERLEIVLDKFMKEGFMTRIWAFKPNKFYHCPYDRLNSFVINYDGKLHKCVARDYKKAMGRIIDGSIHIDENFYNTRCKTAIDLQECLRCKELPICFGPCLQKISESEDVNKLCVLKNSEISIYTYIKKKADEMLASIQK